MKLSTDWRTRKCQLPVRSLQKMSSFVLRRLAILHLLAAGLSSLLHMQGSTEAAFASREALFLEKRGLCMALSHTMCQLPLEVQLFALNTAVQFADTYGRNVHHNADD